MISTIGCRRCWFRRARKQKRTVRILPRGNWMDESGEVVQAALPHFLPQPKIEGREPDAAGSGRLARLARQPAYGPHGHEPLLEAILRRGPEPRAR